MEKRAGHGGRHEAGGPWLIQAACGLTTVLQREGLLRLLKVCKKMSWRAQQAWCWGLGPGPKAGPMRQDGADADMGRGPDTELREKTDRHAETLQSREAAFFDPSAADQSLVASYSYPVQASSAPFRRHRSILAHSPFGSHLITHFMLSPTHTLSDHLACLIPSMWIQSGPCMPCPPCRRGLVTQSPLSSIQTQPRHSICSIPIETRPSHTVSSISHTDPGGPSNPLHPTHTYTGHSVRSDPHAMEPVSSTLLCPKWAWSACTGTTGMYA